MDVEHTPGQREVLDSSLEDFQWEGNLVVYLLDCLLMDHEEYFVLKEQREICLAFWFSIDSKNHWNFFSSNREESRQTLRKSEAITNSLIIVVESVKSILSNSSLEHPFHHQISFSSQNPTKVQYDPNTNAPSSALH